MDEPEELLRAAAQGRDRRLAEMFTLVFGIACETHSEIIRDALSKLLPDLRVTNEAASRAVAIATSAQQQAHNIGSEATALFEAVGRQCEDIERRLDAIVQFQDKLDARMRYLSNRLDKAAKVAADIDKKVAPAVKPLVPCKNGVKH